MTVRIAILVASLLLGPGSTSYAVLVASHIGQANPTTEGWTAVAGPDSSLVVVGGVANDAGSGLNAWSVNDTSTLVGSTLFYQREPTFSEIGQASSSGWIFRANLRVVGTNDVPFGSIFMQYADGNIEYDLFFGADADGDPTVIAFDGTGVSGGVPNGPSFTSEGSGGGYHLYELRFNSAENSADLYVDGVERISNYSGFSVSDTPRIAFGGFSGTDTGHGNYNLVEFSAIPEPSAFLFSSVVAAILAAKSGIRSKILP